MLWNGCKSCHCQEYSLWYVFSSSQRGSIAGIAAAQVDIQVQVAAQVGIQVHVQAQVGIQDAWTK